MLNSIQIIFLATLWTSVVYWVIPSKFPEARRFLLLAVSALLIFVFNPRALALAILITLLALAVFKHVKANPDRINWLWIVCLPLAVDAVIPLSYLLPFPVGAPRSPIVQHLTTLGLSFYSLKLYGSLKAALKTGSISFRELITAVLFFPAFPMGPIDFTSAFSSNILSRAFDALRYVRGFLRIGVGIAKAFVICAWLSTDVANYCLGVPLSEINVAFWKSAPAYIALFFAYLNFAILYLNFSGFTDVAIGSAWLLNIDLTENFNRPLLAHSIQNFWQRWHLSLSQFITKFLFKPMLRVTGRPAASMVATFTLVGLWHKVSLGYLIWGFGHGVGLALYARYAAENRKGHVPSLAHPMTWLKILATLTFVSLLSAIANQPSTKSLFVYLAALIPLV